MGRTCPEYELTEQSIGIISSAAALHDIGKIAIPDSILMKPGRLTDDEWKIMETHAQTGCRILDSLSNVTDKDYLRYAHNICHYHHERWDGHGYPEGLAGEAIPICAQVVGLADAYDALTSKRVYKEAYPFAQAVNMIVRGECGAFSPKLLECFKHVTYQYEELARAYADGMAPADETFDATLPAPQAAGQQDTLERFQGKYYALAHYINGFLIELDMDKQIFHLVYNPYPEFAELQQMNSLDDIKDMILKQFIHPDDEERMRYFLQEGIPAFLRAGLRRANYRFRARSREFPSGELYELTLMRMNPLDVNRRTLAALVRRIEERMQTDSGWRSCCAAENTYCCRNDAGYTLVEAGNDLKKLTGYTDGEIFTRFGGRMMEVIHPQDRERVRLSFAEQLQKGAEVEAEYRIVNREGAVRWVMNKSRLVSGADGIEMLCTSLTDITESKDAVNASEEKMRRYEMILSQTGNILFEWDMGRDEIAFSDTWENIFGFEPIRGKVTEYLRTSSHFHPDDLPLLSDKLDKLENGSENETVEVRISTNRGRYLWCRIRATAVCGEEGQLEKISGIIVNIDKEKQAERILQSRAEHDSLTKLLNKEAARERAEGYFARYPDGVNCALMIIDLDDFKQVNDQYGHLFGDAILTQVSRQIKMLFRSQDIVARIGGDEFLVLVRGISDRMLLEQRCGKLLQSLKEIFQNKRHQLPMSCSIGIAQSPLHGKNYYELYHCADQALYQAKAQGKNRFVFYSGESHAFLSKPGCVSAVSNTIDSDIEPGLADDHIVRYVFGKLYSSQNVEESINEILAYIGKKMNVSRVYVFENSDDNKCCSNTYEWCNDGIRSELNSLQQVSYETDIPGYEDYFNEEGIFYCADVTEPQEEVYNILAPQGIKSMLQCAIRENGVFRGYIGFDECVEQRLWTKEQINVLTFFSESLSMFLLQMRQQQKVQRQADELTTILGNQDACIYVVDPDDFRFRFVNEKMRRQFPEAQLGQVCYRTVTGENTVCANCPTRDLKKIKHVRFVDGGCKGGSRRLTEGTLIRWNDKDAYLISCRELPD